MRGSDGRHLAAGGNGRRWVAVHNGGQVISVTRDADGTAVRFAHGSTQVVDAVLVAVWRSPRTADLGLSEAGVEVGDRGYVTVNDRMQTTNPRIWAAGDGVRKAAIADPSAQQ